jgi:hypothetical protein
VTGRPKLRKVIAVGEKLDLRQIERRDLRPRSRDVHERFDGLCLVKVETDHAASIEASVKPQV